MIHLDTNFLVIEADDEKEQHQQILRWIAQGESISTSAMAWAEFQCGSSHGLSALDDETARAFISKIVPINENIAELAGRLYNSTGRRSRSLADCIIAATAILDDAPLATANGDDFTVFVEHGLRLAN